MALMPATWRWAAPLPKLGHSAPDLSRGVSSRKQAVTLERATGRPSIRHWRNKMATTPSSKPSGGITLLGRAPAEPVDLNQVALVLNPLDAVAVAKQPLLPNTKLRTAEGEVRVAQMVPPGHKVALRPIAKGDEIRKYGQIIGFAT